MLIKDRIRTDNIFQKGGVPNKGDHSEPCRWYNCRHCSYGLNCKFDHRCSVTKCGKFGHGAFMCRLRNSDDRLDNC